MKAWSALALILWLALLAYTGIVVSHHGLNLLPVFFGDMAKFAWPGQFNLDFMLMLFVSASWTMWRGRFRPSAVALGVAAFFLGASFLLPYLAWLISLHKGDMSAVLLGHDYSGNQQS